LKAVIASEGYGWDVRLVNLQQVLDPLDIFRKITGIRLEDIYNLLLAKGWTLGSSYLLRLMHGVIRVYHRPQVKLLTDFWRKDARDMVVSLVPNFNRALFESMQQSIPGVPFVTVLTDFADYPPHFWMERQPLQYIVCGTQRALEQARQLGHPAERTFQVSGMILRPEFYQPQIHNRGQELRALGLDPNLPTGLVLFGGEGSGVMHSIAQRLGSSRLQVQLILICGRNAKLKQRVEALRTRNGVCVQGFTKEIPYFMSLCDFFIGKPGPGSISEAIQMGLPVIVECNAWTLPQERYNAKWVQENGVGIVLPNFRNVEQAVREILKPERFQQMKARVGAIRNRAVYEIPEILSRIVTREVRGFHPSATFGGHAGQLNK
jgi:1,2-diacylglycerol 3-beta-galactosyltransferase